MKYRKCYLVVAMMFLLMLMISGCGEKKSSQTSTVYFYKEYYHEEKNYREEEIILQKGCKEIGVLAETSSGTIHMVIENLDVPELRYEYEVEGTLSDTIEIEKKYIDDQWVLRTEIDENTEGSVSLTY